MLGLVLKSESRYKVLEALERGTRGKVYLVEKLQLGRRYRLKVLPAALLKQATTDPEIEILTRWEHGGILKAHACFRGGNDLFLVQDYVSGQSLKMCLAADEPVADVAKMFVSLLETLQHVHTKGFLHGNLRPEYLWVDTYGRILISDFGNAIRREGGGLPWIAPEPHACQAPERERGDPGGPEADLYSVGVLLRMINPRSENKKLDSVISRATEPLPSARFHEASDFAQALTDATSQDDTETAANTLLFRGRSRVAPDPTPDADVTARLPRSYYWSDPAEKTVTSGIWGDSSQSDKGSREREGSRNPFDTLLDDLPDESEDVDGNAETRLLKLERPPSTLRFSKDTQKRTMGNKEGS